MTTFTFTIYRDDEPIEIEVTAIPTGYGNSDCGGNSPNDLDYCDYDCDVELTGKETDAMNDRAQEVLYGE